MSLKGLIMDALGIRGGDPVRPLQGGVRVRLDLEDQRVYEHSVAYYSNAFRACLLAKARPLASLPVHVYKRGSDGSREEADAPAALALSRLLRGRWNPFLTAGEGMRWAMMTKDVRGNAFIRVQWGSDGAPRALWPMSDMPDVQVTRSGRVTYRYGGDKFAPAGTYLDNEIVWIESPIIDADGLWGVSLAKVSASELGLSIDLDEFYKRLITNGSHFPGWLETDAKLEKPDVDKIRSQLEDGAGIVSAGKVRIFDHGLTYHQTQLTMADMSLVEQEKWILQQTCRTLSVPPQEVFDLSHATYSNIEQGSLNFANKTLVPECVTFETAMGGILESAGCEGCYVQLDMNGLLRGSYRERMEGYRIAILASMMSPDEARAKEDMPPYKGGEYFFRPSAYIPVNPETGDELEGARRASASHPKPGGSGEAPDAGGPDQDPAPQALQQIHEDMRDRVAERFRERGDCPATRDFAAKVLAPYARACLTARVDYDMESDIEGIAAHA